MKNQKDDVILRVIPQLTFSKRIVTLIAEESKGRIIKGRVMKKISVNTLDKMKRPLSMRVINGGVYIPLLK